jgi:hypothetical protein
MYSFSADNANSSRTKVDFPVDLAVDNVTLRSITANERILGIDFNFQRVEGDTISWLTGSILPPKKEWFTQSKVVNGKTITAEEQYQAGVSSFMGYVRHILTAAGVPITAFKNISGETLEEVISSLISTVNPLIDTKALFYLKTVKDKNGYTRIPQFRGNGVAQSMDLGYPSKFSYSTYEADIMKALDIEGVVDNTTPSAPNSGLDF